MIRYVCAFVLHRHEQSSDVHRLMMRVKWDGCRSIVSLSLGFDIDPDGWDASRQECRARTLHGRARIPASTVNREILRCREAVGTVFADLGALGVLPTVDEVRRTLKSSLGLGSQGRRTTEEAWDEFLKEGGSLSGWKPGTITKLRVVSRHVGSFSPFRTLDGFTAHNFSAYIQHLRSGGMSDSSIEKNCDILRWFLKWCDSRKLLRSDDWKWFRPKFRESTKPIIFLTWEEVSRVWGYRGPEVHEQVRDLFLFSCFTSLRWSDINALRWSDVTETDMRIVATKTGKPLTIDLNRFSQEILGRYLDVSYPDDKVFPDVSNQICNRFIKEICRDVGIDSNVSWVEWSGAKRCERSAKKYELVSFHAGRRTFVSQALALGVAPTTVMKWTGHSDYSAMKPYIEVSEQTRAESMVRWDSLSVTPL